MQYRNTVNSYGAIAKLFHWVIFLLIVCLLTVGFLMTDMENSPDKFRVYGLHKACGITVLFLVILRLLWKLRNISPRLPDTLDARQKKLAHAGHWMLYLLMFAMPVSGWLMSSAAGFPVSVFGFFTLPDLIAPNKAAKEFFQETHEIIGYLIIFMVSLHIVAALLHHFYFRDNVLKRILPFQRE